jgi:hypothetical protein
MLEGERITRKLTGASAPPRPRRFLRNFFASLRAQLIAASWAALLATQFAEGDRCGVLLAGSFFGRFLWGRLRSQRFTRGRFHDGTGELADIEGLRFFA